MSVSNKDLAYKRNAKWAGLRNTELQKVSQIKTAKFCHRNLFIANADTLEDALLFVENSK